ncbi:MAG: hypothetical protein LBC79_08425 [Deltaproteobacteria bacterium]|jgi:hypothetical protein|nr:hypothetical protein [Deltaproteobacteria bacterium]
MSRLLNRRFWNPLLVVSGSLVMISGLFLLFHLMSRPIMLVHHIGGVIFPVACIAHGILNRKALANSLGSRAAVCAALAVILLAGLSMAFSDVEHTHQHMMRRMAGATPLR